jgi:alcohol dehydrogenase
MKALVLLEEKKLELRNVEEPKIKDGWVKIRVKRVGICGTDKAFFSGSYKLPKKPIILGHEVSGVIEEGDKDLIGEKVTSEINVNCKSCYYCLNSMPTQCPYRETIGITLNGGMAEFLLTRRDLIHVNGNLSYRELALVEPLAAVLEMHEMEPVKANSIALVIGLGTIGLMSVQVLKLHGAKVIALSRNSSRSKIAEELGADEVVGIEEIEEKTKRITKEGAGFDYVVEASGSEEGVRSAIKLVRPRGVIAAKSTNGREISFDYTSLVVKEVRLIGSRCGPFNKAMKLIEEGKVNVGKLVTSEFTLGEGVKAFEKSIEGGEIKVQIVN